MNDHLISSSHSQLQKLLTPQTTALTLTLLPDIEGRDSLWNNGNSFHAVVGNHPRTFHCFQSMWKLQILLCNVT